MTNEMIASALIEYSNLMRMDDIRESFVSMDNEFRLCDKLFETIDNCNHSMYILTEGAKFDNVKKVANSAVKALIRKLKTLISQLLATLKKIAGINKITETGNYIDINKAMSVLDKLNDDIDLDSITKKYYAGEKIDVNKLQSLINRCNKMIDILERNDDQESVNKKLQIIKNILNQSKTLMDSLFKSSKNLSASGAIVSPKVIAENKERFKEKYQYDPKNKTIVVDGETYRVRMSSDRDTEAKGLSNGIRLDHKSIGTSANLLNKRGGIYLDDSFWKLKNDQQRGAILAHEIGHLKYHSVNVKSRHLDKDAVVNGNVEKARTAKSSNFSDYDNRGFDENNKKLEKLVEKNKNNQRNIDRRENIEKYKRYENPKIPHANTDEFEADRYAANKYGNMTLKKALKNSVKIANSKKEFNKLYDQAIDQQKKSIDGLLQNDFLSEKDKEDLREVKYKLENPSVQVRLNKWLTRMMTKYQRHKDLQARFKALKDTEIKADVYRDKAKNEAVELLCDELTLCETADEVNIVFDALEALLS